MKTRTEKSNKNYENKTQLQDQSVRNQGFGMLLKLIWHVGFQGKEIQFYHYKFWSHFPP